MEKLVNMLFSREQGIQYASDPIAVLINSLGGLSVLETQAFADQVTNAVRQRNPAVARFFASTFVMSLDGPGFSFTLQKLDNGLPPLLDAPTAVSNWQRNILWHPPTQEKLCGMV